MEVALQISAIILSVVATVISGLGFFASLNLYRDSRDLQTEAQNLLSRVDEKLSAVQSQIGGMFDKTLDAAIAQGKVAPQDAEEAQARLLKRVSEEESDAGREDPGGNLAQEVMDYFNLKGLMFTDVSTPDARAIFSLGSQHGFNLFDAEGQIVFFGYFHRDDVRKTAARVRFLMTNIDSAYQNLESLEPEVRTRGRELLDQIRIVLLVPEDADVGTLQEVIATFQPEAREIDVEVLRPSDLRGELNDLYSEVWPV